MNKKNSRLITYLVLGLVLLTTMGVSAYIINNEKITANAVKSNSASGKSSQAHSPVETEVNEALIEKVLKKLSAEELHNPPFSSSTPKIEINVDDLIYGAEVKKGTIHVTKGTIEGEDISISLSKENAIEIANSQSPEKIIRNSVINGELSFQIYSSKPVLFSKGYLALYNRFN